MKVAIGVCLRKDMPCRLLCFLSEKVSMSDLFTFLQTCPRCRIDIVYLDTSVRQWGEIIMLSSRDPTGGGDERLGLKDLDLL